MKWAPMAQVLFIAIAAVSVYAFVSAAKEGEIRRTCTPLCSLRPHYASDDRVAPDFELTALDGRKVKLSDYRGKVVIMNFWTKSCPPCLKEMPDLAELAQLLKDNPKVEMITVSTDESIEDASNTLRSVLSGDAPFLTLLDPEGEIVNGKYGTRLYPETWFIDPQGVIRARFDGPRKWTDPLVLDLAEGLASGLKCEVKFESQKTTEDPTRVCDDVPPAGS